MESKPVIAPEPAAERAPQPLSNEPSIEITTPRFIARRAVVGPNEPPVPTVSAVDPEGVRMEQGRVSFTLAPLTAGLAAGALVALVVLVWVVAFRQGRAAGDREMAPLLARDAGAAIEADPVPTPREPVTEASQDAPVSIVTPAVITPELRTEPPVVPESTTGAEPASTAADESEQNPDQDTRVPGLNYLHLGTLFDREETVRTLEFLRGNEIRCIALEGTAGGRAAFRIVTLHGVSGPGYSTKREKIEHDARIFELGEQWRTEHRGQLDFSRASQVQWTLYNP